MKDKIADILKAYTKKKGISASFVILENYAEELVKNGCVIQESKVETTANEAEIMKAFEVCKNHRCYGKHCPFYEYDDCEDRFIDLLVDLINRKNAENERLKKIINTSAIILPARKCGKTFLIKTTIEKITESARTAARAEAIKEFAERVKKEAYFDSAWCVLPVDGIDQIAKEMGVDV